MNKQDRDDLICNAKQYINHDIEILVGIKPSFKKLKKFKFININEFHIGVGENGKEVTFPIPNAILESSDGKVVKKSLLEIVRYFENKQINK